MTIPCTQSDKISELHIKTELTQAFHERMEKDLDEVKKDLKDVKTEITEIKQQVSNLSTQFKEPQGQNKKEILLIAIIIGIVVRVADPKLAEVVLSFFK